MQFHGLDSSVLDNLEKLEGWVFLTNPCLNDIVPILWKHTELPCTDRQKMEKIVGFLDLDQDCTVSRDARRKCMNFQGVLQKTNWTMSRLSIPVLHGEKITEPELKSFINEMNGW